MGTAALSFTVGGDLKHIPSTCTSSRLLLFSWLVPWPPPRLMPMPTTTRPTPPSTTPTPTGPASPPPSLPPPASAAGARGLLSPASTTASTPVLLDTPPAPATWPGPPRAWARGPLTLTLRPMPVTTTVPVTVTVTPGPTAMATPELTATAMVTLMLTDTGNQLFFCSMLINRNKF